ncbi:D-alanyl-D-alanine carboxypeptidase/D-alanyl-D-alanine endopeptidase [Corynebacterium lowii]|uniref:D-alanyl-D-alanine carboxypeptidase DacB n=1 Tax=Corynebacterium lowii TaxID=1544413 RepID=A0A0Q0UIX3_9CORY|nr:D-alanyl-D-alanine carboxypeptidase/D-alanyl-D-alanine-endopeptidase [Corynebacterium lowii]KQB86184.1 D-alanyl-D-alanine carboxypeptidase DacB precursor [Corynebacterium lowii]MDP9852658.1 D-alanyl-D-alanine carboxypeptidase/D-alanyl-D-alanine-endopeptidase (penicillin-binding protein 4) [Corynebacterium lowii]
MSKKAWIAAAAAVAVVVAGVAGTGVAYQDKYSSLSHAPALTIDAPAPLLEPAAASGPVDNTALGARLASLTEEQSKALADFGAQVTDAVTGEKVWSHNATTALRPASSTKVLTAAAAIAALGHDDRITTAVVRGELPGTVVIKAAGDVWLTPERMDDLAAQIKQAMPEVSGVFIDTSAWSGEAILEGWNPEDVDAGFVAPLEPAMIYGARLGATTGDVPRSHTPALDVAQALAQRLGVSTVGQAEAPAKEEKVAEVSSPTLVERIAAMMEDSDNVMAEAIGREVALHRGYKADAAGATQATLATLKEQGLNTAGVEIFDNSGLSVKNRITPALLDAILHEAAAEPLLRPIVASLPVAGGTGTLAERYGDLPGRGWVRAKTGTLDETSALAGVVTATSGRVYSFAMISNGSDVLEARRAMDTLASAIREN